MNIDDSLQQVRQAHRICAGFYQQVLPRIERVKELLEVQFLQWMPMSFESPPSKGVSPFKYWAWHFLPLIDASFTFVKTSGSRYFCPDDYILDIRLITDSELAWEYRQETYGQQEPDACALNNTALQADSYLAIYLFSTTKRIQHNDLLNRIWNNCDYPERDAKVVLNENGSVKALGFTFPLADFVQEEGPEKVIEAIKRHHTLMSIKAS